MGLLTVPALYVLKCLLYAHDKKEIFLQAGDNHEYETRHRNKLVPHAHRSSKFESHPAFQCIKMYNFLPNTFKEMSNAKFKNKLKEILSKKVLYSVKEFYCIKPEEFIL